MAFNSFMLEAYIYLPEDFRINCMLFETDAMPTTVLQICVYKSGTSAQLLIAISLVICRSLWISC